MLKINDIERDIKNLQSVANAMDGKDYLKAYNSCRLCSDIFYKPVDVIEAQLRHNIGYDLENDTEYAKEYALHLKKDAERLLQVV